MKTSGLSAPVMSAAATLSSALFLFTTAMAQDRPPEPQPAAPLTVQHYPRYYYDNDSRQPKFTLLFSEKVDQRALAGRLFFEDDSGKGVPAVLRAAMAEEIGRTWGYYGPAGTASPPADRFVTATPSRPLPVGKSWHLVIPEGIRAAGNAAVLAKPVRIGAGSVHPFEIRELEAANPYDEKRKLQIYCSKKLAPAAAAQISQFVSVLPQPNEVAFEVQGGLVTITGAFDFGVDYRVLVRAGLAAEDGLELEKPFEKTASFRPQSGFITLPDHELVQPLSGSKTFQVRTGNLRSLRVRVKSLGRDELIYALRGYRIYDPETADEKGQRYPPFEMVPGRTIHDKELPLRGELDQSQEIALHWPEISGQPGPAALYLSVEGDSMEHPQLAAHRVGAQSLVQLTDLGVVWKQSQESALVYAFSLTTGKPVPGAEVQMISDDNEALAAYTTNPEGVATLPLEGRNQKTRWLVTRLGQDRYATAFDPASRRGIPTWDFDVRQPWWGEPRQRLRTFLFTDRGVYRPGDEVHLKALARQADGNELRFPGGEKGIPAKLLVCDAQDREVLNRPVQFSERGSLDQSFVLPAEVTGTYRIQVDFASFLGKSAEDPEEDHIDRFAYHYISVADYRPNTFEVKLDCRDSYRGGEPIDVRVSANYLRGKPLSQARAAWKSSYEVTRFHPAGFDDYEFGSAEVELRNSDAREEMLDAGGELRLPLNFIPRQGLEQPLEVSLTVDVTDVNQQTISESRRLFVHSSDFYLGVKPPRGWLNAGQPAAFELKSVRADGRDYAEPLKGTLIVEREVVETVKVQGAGDVPQHRNETRYEEVQRREFALPGGAGKEEIAFKDPGAHRLTWTVATPAGGTVQTVTRRYVWGDGDVYWAHRDGEAIELAPESKSYRVGDTARIMVRSPMLGTALITTERAGVYRTVVRELASKSELIEIPITSQAAPNLFVSVLVIRGSQDSPHRYRDTEYKLGYCELAVDEPATRLQVDLSLAKPEIRPGELAVVKLRVQDAEGRPAGGQEVAVWAVDEGVLSLTGYEVPDPAPELHAAYPLYVRTWHSLFNVLTENPGERPFGNKGLMIGGGGDGLAALQDRPRKDFRATAFWNGSLITDPNGELDVQFPAPDSLTRYRVFAVAAAGTDRFGTKTARLVVSKPVIVEPALPAFANVGDRHLLQAVVHNTTSQPGDFEVTLKLDGKVLLQPAEGQVIPASLDAGAASREWRENLRLEAASTRALPIPVTFAAEGESVMTWTIREQNAAQPRSDSVESRLKIGYPVPRLSEIRHLRVKGGQQQQLLASFEKNLLQQGKGQLDVTISNSRLLEASDALEFNLHYPYGCVEQTTSSTLPWMTMQQLGPVFPSLRQEPGMRERAVKSGLERLLSMQTQEGGLGYWPGADAPTLWASAYGGMALALAAREKTVPLPEARLQSLWQWLSSQLRGAEDTRDAEELHQRCLALYTLALAGVPETSYHETYYQKRATLAPESRALLSLAILQAGTPAQKALVPAILSEPRPAGAPEHAVSWYGPGHLVSLRLLAALRQDPGGSESSKLLDQLLRLRQPRNGWGSTYSNAWPLLALAEVARHEQAAPPNAACSLQFAGETKQVGLENSFASAAATFPFERDLGRETCLLSVASQGEVFVRVSLSIRPERLSAEPVNRGFTLKRAYLRLNLDGSLEPSREFEVGDLVVVRLDVQSPQPEQVYLALDDPLPSLFEGIDPAFVNRGKAALPAAAGAVDALPTSHKELRQDRALFFCNELGEPGNYRVEYLARVVASGEVTAPPAKIEAMYEPQRYGLAATTRIRAFLPGQTAKKVAAE